MKVGVVGQGYVGLPLAKSLVEADHTVYGIDINPTLIQHISAGKSHVEDISDEELVLLLETNRYFPTNSYQNIESCDVVVICVPTPLKENGSPDLSYLDSTTEFIISHLKKGVLLILESTSFPGTTRDLIFKKVLRERNWEETDIFCAFSPERVDPLNREWNVTNTPKLVSGVNAASCDKAVTFYSTFVDKVVRVEKAEAAEFAKLIENAYRLVNISFVNEMSMLARKAGLDINAILDAASTKPYGFQRFSPGLGAGGHCIPVDPVYLQQYAASLEMNLPLLDVAIETNSKMPTYHANKVLDALKEINRKSLKVLLVGIAYKPGVSDIRESQAIALLGELNNQGAEIFWSDPLISNLPIGMKHHPNNIYDVVILNHSWSDLDEYKLQPHGIFYTVS